MSEPTLTVLVADDDATNRLLLEAILRQEGYGVIHAENGREAVESFSRERPDLVLMDVRMPEMDGYEATQKIKAMSGDTFVPVIFLTANSDIDSMVRSIESGGDDFLAKPYNRIQLQARINALMRIRELYSTVQQQRDELRQHHKRLERERQLAKRLFTNIVHTDVLDKPNIRYRLSPMSLFSGDILLAAVKPSGGLHLLLGDFTGHGLAAATGALPVSSIFYGMTAKGYAIAEIVAEINARLLTILPVDMFLAACVVDLDASSQTLSVWNGGLPPFLVYDAEQRAVRQRVDSTHLPLGIVGDEQFESRVEVAVIRPGDHLFICSDGVLETPSPQGERFGHRRFNGLFAEKRPAETLFDELLQRLQAFQAGSSQQDDVTLVEVVYDQRLLDVGDATLAAEGRRGGRNDIPPTSWEFDFTLKADMLRHVDPLPPLIQTLVDLQGFRGRRQQLYTIFSELYSNALEHGLLGLASNLKDEPNGFARYYQLRDQRLLALDEGEIRIHLRHRPEAEGGCLEIRFEDSGSGFDPAQVLPALSENLSKAGRGIQLVRSLCDEVRFNHDGNGVVVHYRWR